MASTYYLTREYELFAKAEATYGVNPTIGAGDAFKHKPSSSVTRQTSRYYRDSDAEYQRASVLEQAIGRQKSAVSIETDIVPSGNASTITEPDVDQLLLHHFGQKHKATAHTTTAAGSSGTAINFTTGGVAASGVAAGDLIAIDVSATFGYEVRRVAALPGGDVVTVDRAFSADPAASRTVKLGTTYSFLNTYVASLWLWQFLGGNDRKYAVPGLLLNQFEMAINASEETPVGSFKFSGEGKLEVTHADARPTPTTAGSVLVPSVGRAWLGATKYCIVDMNLTSNNGRMLREKESCSLQPTAIFAGGRYEVNLDMSLLYTKQGDAGEEDSDTLYANAASAPALDTIIQLSQTPGQIVALCAPNWRPDSERSDIDNERGIQLSGRVLGTAGDDELRLAFL